MSDHEIHCGDYSARISSRGATLRSLQHRKRDLIVQSSSNEPNPDYRGIIAAPWPNRIADGIYTFEGITHELPINEPERGSALHGLVFDKEWDVDQSGNSSVALSHTITAPPGYPFTLHSKVEYTLTQHGLGIALTTTNTGDGNAPYGACLHPYLIAGPAPLDEWILYVEAERYVEVTPDRLLPVAERNVRYHPFDFTKPCRIGTTKIDHAFTGLRFNGQNRAMLTLHDPSGVGVGMAWDDACPWVQLHTADRPSPKENRAGLAVEPMTCPPDAFNSGQDLVPLSPGEQHTVSCQIFAL